MPARLRLALVVLAVCLAAGAGAIGIAARGGDDQDGSGGFAGALRPAGAPPVEFALRDQDGRHARLADFRGHVVVVTFLYSTCDDTCPLQAQQVRGALDDLGHDVPTVAFSVDPAGDTPERARRFLLKQRMTGRMRFLLGSRAQLAPVWRGYGIQPQRRGFEHTASIVLLDGTGRQRVGFPVDRVTPEALAHDIAALERERTRGGARAD